CVVIKGNEEYLGETMSTFRSLLKGNGLTFSKVAKLCNGYGWGLEALCEDLCFNNMKESLSLKHGLVSRTPDRRLLELEDQINFLIKGPQLVPKESSTHVPQPYVKAVSSIHHQQNLNEPPRQNSFTFCERIDPYPQPQALETTFEARVRDYMAAHTERMERFENAIFKQREEINNRMIEMLGLLKELTISKLQRK
ncbi:hypothetical protein Tco_0879807, partial [Tanacetum coccineum]